MKSFSWVSVLVISLVSSLGALYLDHTYFQNNSTNYQSVTEKQNRDLSIFKNDTLPAFSANVNFVATSKSVRNAVVYIRTKGRQNGESLRQLHQNIPEMDEFFQMPDFQGEGSGSGVILTEDGLIVTNNHVVEGAKQIQVLLNNKQSFEAKLIGRDPSTDLALLKINGRGFPFLKYGNSERVQIGEWVLAIGNPFDLTSTVTAGIISGKGRSINILREKSNLAIESFIQTDAAVNPGNSGGALVDLRGELIGINTAIASPTGSYSGYSFAVPVNLVKKVIDDLLQFGAVQRALLGVSIVDVTADFAKEIGLKSLDGVFVREVSSGSSAEKCGIKKGDVITKINNFSVNSVPELQEIVGQFHPGDQIRVEIVRQEKTMVLTAILKNENGESKIAISKPIEGTFVEEFGAEFRPITDSQKGKYGISSGLEITSIKTQKLKKIGLESGCILFKLDKKRVKIPQDLVEIYNSGSGGLLIEAIFPDGNRQYLVLVK